MLGKGHKVMKVSRRDLPFVIAQGHPRCDDRCLHHDYRGNGGIAVLPPAGSAGVHRGAEHT